MGEFDGPTVGVRLTLQEAQVVDEMAATIGPVRLSRTDIVRMLFREGLRWHQSLADQPPPDRPKTGPEQPRFQKKGVQGR
jgi:hypothetical protein